MPVELQVLAWFCPPVDSLSSSVLPCGQAEQSAEHMCHSKAWMKHDAKGRFDALEPETISFFFD